MHEFWLDLTANVKVLSILISAYEQTVRLISTCFGTFLEWQISLKFDFILDKFFFNMTN